MPCLAIDGDSAVCSGTRYRLVGFDTPELHRPACGAERALAYIAKQRIQKMLDGGAVVIQVPCRYGPRDHFGRACGLLMTREGALAADLMIAEGLASPIWPNAPTFRRKDWCNGRG